MALSQRLEQGRVAFNRGEYFEAHELWEDAWRELAGAERIFVQGLIQIAAGLHHLQQRRPLPAAAQGSGECLPGRARCSRAPARRGAGRRCGWSAGRAGGSGGDGAGPYADQVVVFRAYP
jgi:hypothetical protein